MNGYQSPGILIIDIGVGPKKKYWSTPKYSIPKAVQVLVRSNCQLWNHLPFESQRTGSRPAKLVPE